MEEMGRKSIEIYTTKYTEIFFIQPSVHDAHLSARTHTRNFFQALKSIVSFHS